MPMRLIPLHLQPYYKPLQNDSPVIRLVSLIFWISAAAHHCTAKLLYLMRGTHNRHLLRKFLLFSQSVSHQASKHFLAAKAMLVLHYQEQFLLTSWNDFIRTFDILMRLWTLQQNRSLHLRLLVHLLTFQFWINHHLLDQLRQASRYYLYRQVFLKCYQSSFTCTCCYKGLPFQFSFSFSSSQFHSI